MQKQKDKEEQNNDNENGNNKKKSSVVITIPSYQEVLQSSVAKSTPPSLFFLPKPFLKHFPSSNPPISTTLPPATTAPPSRETGESNTPSSTSTSATSVSASSSTLSSSQVTQSRNAILVSHRQEDVMKPQLEVTKTALLHGCTLLCGWSLEECGRYLETIKVYENKPADIIQGQMDTDYLSQLTHVLTTVRHVNKTDVVTLGTTFGSLSHIMDASMEDLARCPGIGERKNTPTCPDTLVRNNAESSSLNDDKQNDVEDRSKRRKKEPECTVKSTLSAAFAKYCDRIGKRNSSSQVEEKGESQGVIESEAEIPGS